MKQNEVNLNPCFIKDIVERWENLNFLENLNEDEKINAALNFESACIYLIENETKFPYLVEMCVFPIIKMLIQQHGLKKINIFKLVCIISNFLKEMDDINNVDEEMKIDLCFKTCEEYLKDE